MYGIIPTYVSPRCYPCCLQVAIVEHSSCRTYKQSGTLSVMPVMPVMSVMSVMPVMRVMSVMWPCRRPVGAHAPRRAAPQARSAHHFQNVPTAIISISLSTFVRDGAGAARPRSGA